MADLAPYFRQAARLLEPGGNLFFSVDPAPDDMEIGESGPGEYAHSRSYLRRCAAETGFSEVAIAVMGHRATPGFWCAFRKEPMENTLHGT
jgi:predicted TPR repeat methyltransferase